MLKVDLPPNGYGNGAAHFELSAAAVAVAAADDADDTQHDDPIVSPQKHIEYV